jgi:hypothetical protein
MLAKAILQLTMAMAMARREGRPGPEDAGSRWLSRNFWIRKIQRTMIVPLRLHGSRHDGFRSYGGGCYEAIQRLVPSGCAYGSGDRANLKAS